MRIAVGYHHCPMALGTHMERALLSEGHEVQYVGLPCPDRAGYDSAVPLPALLAGMSPRPDLYLWVDPGAPYFPLGLEEAPIPTACYLVDVHLGRWRQQVARFFDAVFIAQKDYLPLFREAVGHDQVYWLPLAANPDVHRQHDLPRIYDVGFAGNISIVHRDTARARRLRLLAGKFRVNDFTAVYSPAEVGRLYSQSKIVFNNSISGDVNMRIFEGMASGGMMLTDADVNGLTDLFEPGKEVVAYHDDADLLDKVAHYLAHEDERDRIAAAGRQRVLAEHLYTHRMRRVVEVVSAPTFRRCAALRGATPEACWPARKEVYTHLHMVDALLDDAQEQGLGPLRRAWAAWPCIARHLLRHCMRRRFLPSDTPTRPR